MNSTSKEPFRSGKTDRGFRLLSIDKITDSPHLNLFRIKYRDRIDNAREWIVASRNKQLKCDTGDFKLPDAVVIVAYHIEKKRLVIIKEFRVPLGNYQYGLPAGLVDPGEDIKTAASRELYEETGLTLNRHVKQSPTIYSSSGLTDESIALVYVECSGEPSRISNSNSEDIQTLLVSPEEAGDLCNDPTLMFDVKTWLVMSEYAGTGKVF